jgi:hypothetical protein
VLSSSTGVVGVFDNDLFEEDDEILGALLLEEEDEIVVELMLVDEEEDKILAALLFEELGVLCNDAMGVFTVTLLKTLKSDFTCFFRSLSSSDDASFPSSIACVDFLARRSSYRIGSANDCSAHMSISMD